MPLPISDQTNTTHFAQGVSVLNRHAMSYWRFAVLLAVVAVVAVVAFAPITAVAEHGASVGPDTFEPNDIWEDAVPLVTDGVDVALTFHYTGYGWPGADYGTGDRVKGDQDWFSFDAI